ncbi:MAG TPA: nucleotidyltransferase domain-containing protein [Rubrobacteraceae bacterium]|jgi:predicted nucleotidyltransferase|nr:nucleotidyltransferase domain-containing protein [Rubrobacteraceae bacterium]
MQAPVELAQQIAGRLGEIEGVVAVALGGSWARGEAHADSDVDLGIYYRPGNPPRITDLRLLAQELDDRHPPDAVTNFGEWGPWINGGGWLTIEGRRVDWLYRDLDLVELTIGECSAGRPSVYYQPGHPHGFHTHIYMGEIHYSRSLYDPVGELRALKNTTERYPPRLKEALIRRQLWEARFALETCRKSAARGDAFYVAGCLFRCAACMVQTLFALNERYLINEKGSVEVANSLPLRPDNFREIVDSVLARPGGSPQELEGSVGNIEGLLVAVEELCAGVLA